MNKAIILGASGYIGSSVLNELLKNGIDVLAVSRQTDDIFFQNKKNRKRLTHLNLDSSQVFLLPEKIREIKWDIGNDCVFYNFSWEGDKRLMDGTIENQLKNVTHISNSLVVASEMGCKKFINSGSIEETFAENYLHKNWASAPFDSPNAYYAVSKIATKNMCKLLGYLNKIDYIHTRISSAVDKQFSGPGYIVSVFKSILSGDHYERPRNNNLFDLIDLEDLATAYYLIGIHGKNKADYFIGSGLPKKLIDYFDWFERMKLKKDFIPVTYENNLTFDNEQFKLDTGLDLTYSFDSLLKKIFIK
jgi:nucleoside-diphosphate-sugar epimerase